MGYFRTLANAFLGRPVGEGGYYGARLGRRTITMPASTRGATNLALADGPMLLARARGADLNNRLAHVGINAFVSEAIGTGIRPHSKHSDPAIRERIEREFALWAPQASAERRIGLDGKPDSLQDFWGIEALVCRGVAVAGEAFARLRSRRASDLSPTGLRVPLQLELIEPEQLAWWRMSCDGMLPGNIMRGGIEFDQVHQRVAYAFYRHHPGDASVWPNVYEVVRVPAGAVLHLVEFWQGAQVRGITPLAPILEALADLDDFDSAERLKEKLGAYLFGWRETNDPDMDPLQDQARGQVGNDPAPEGTGFVQSEAGQVTMLDTNKGEKFGFYAHPGVPGTYESFVRVQQQQIATAMRVSYDMLTGDMNQVNYSSARVRLIALRRMWQQFQQQVVVQQFCRPLWKAWLDAAALAGVIDVRDYRKRPEEYLNVDWTGQPWEWVDPVKDVQSVRMEIESALTSREAEVAKRGRRVEEVDAEIQRDHIREAKMSIVPVYGASRVTEVVPPGDNGDLAGTEPAPGTEEGR